VMEKAKDELRMPADEFDRIMRGALQTPPPAKQQKPKEMKGRKKASSKAFKRRQK
jgi:hypothetical protein